MSNPMIVWYCLVGIVLVTFLIRLIGYLRSENNRRPEDHADLFGYYKEQEIFYAPGDRKFEDEEDDFDDL